MDPAQLISIAEHLRNEHLMISNFNPSILRSVVENPASLKILPRNVLQRLSEDPIFNVHLPEDSLAKISKILLEKGDEFSADNDIEYEADDYDYDDYIDYSNYEDAGTVETVGSFLRDLNPEFLASVSPALIVGYIEGASPADLKEILNSSTLLRKLPVETIGELLRKLPKDLIIKVVNSKGVQDLFREAFDNVTAEEQAKIKAFQDSLAPIVVQNLDKEIIGSLPLSLLKIHLNIESAVLELFRSSDKLETIINNQPSLLSQINFQFIASILLKHPEVERKIDDGVILALLDARPNILLEFPISFLQNIARDRPGLVANFSEETIKSLASRPEVIFELSNENLMNLIEQKPTILKILLHLPSDILLQLMENRPSLLDIIPANAEESLGEVIQGLVNTSPDVILKFPRNFLLDMARNRPWIVAKFSQEVINSLATRHEILFLLSDKELMRLLQLKPSLLMMLVHLPQDVLLRLLEVKPNLIHIIPPVAEPALEATILQLMKSSPNLVLKLPISFLTDIAATRPWLVAQFPQTIINQIANRHEILFLLSDSQLKKLLSYRPEIMMILPDLPRRVLRELFRQRSNILELIPVQAEPHLRRLLTDTRFLLNVRPQDLAVLAGHKLIQRFLNKYSIISLLRVHPDVVQYIKGSIDHFIRYLEDPWFRMRIPCETVSIMSKNIKLIGSLPKHTLETVLTSKRILSCIPAGQLARLVAHSKELAGVSLSVLMRSATVLPREKYTLNLIQAILMKQTPRIAANFLKMI